jgi:exopolysaccharide biosynthesis polyprenyl glycosylphosphotransferase
MRSNTPIRCVNVISSDRKQVEMSDIRAFKQLQLSAQLKFGWLTTLVLMAGDILGLAIAWQIAQKVNQAFSPLPPQLNWGQWFGLSGLFWGFAGGLILAFVYHNFYSTDAQWRNYVKQAQVISGLYLASLVLVYFYDPKLNAPRSLFFPAWVLSILCVLGLRLILTLLLEQFCTARTQTPVFIIAPADRIPILAELVAARTGYRVVGSVVSSLANTVSAMQLISASGAREVIAENLPETQLASNLYWQLRNAGIGLRLLPSSLMMLHRRGSPEIFAGMPTIRLEAKFFSIWEYSFKRLLDFVGAAIGLIALAPVFVAVAIAIKLTSQGNVFYSQERVGLHGQVFRMWKFRSMYKDAEHFQAELERLNESKDGVMFKIKRDPRIIPIGHFLRRTSMDELPQLFNVLIGQMSLVGPRPLPIRDVARFESWHHTRHLVVPGITGLWQISGRSDLSTIDDAARLDLFYIDHWSLNLDLSILVETVRIVLFGKGAY